MCGLPAYDPAPLWKPEISCLLVMLYDQYTLYLRTSMILLILPLIPPPLCRLSMSSIQSHPSSFSFGSSSLRQGGSTARFFFVYLLQPFFLSGLFFFPLSAASLMKMFSCPGRNSSFIGRGLPTGFAQTYKDVDFIHSSLPHFMCPSVHVLDWSLGSWKFHSAFKEATRSSSSCRTKLY